MMEMTKKELYEGIKEAFYEISFAESEFARRFNPSYCSCLGMRTFLDSIKQSSPEVFKDKLFIMELINDIPFLKEMKDTRLNLPEILFVEYLDEELKRDGEVLLAFMHADRNGYEDPDYLSYGSDEAGIPFDIANLPHGLAVDPEVFSLLLDKTDPVSIFNEILSEDERVDDTFICKLLKWYEQYPIGYVSLPEKIENNIKKLYLLWLDSIDEQFLIHDPFDEIDEPVNPYVKSFFFSLLDAFLDRIKSDIPTGRGLNREWEASIQKTMNSYLNSIKELVLDEIDSVSESNSDWKEERIEAMEEFPFEDYFFEVLHPYMRQMHWFDCVFEGDFTCFPQDRRPVITETIEESETDQGNISPVDIFMKFADLKDPLPFS